MSITPVESWIRPVDERFSIVQGHTQRITAEDLVGTDTGLNGSVISLQSVNQPAHGSLVLNGDGSYAYSPATGYVGEDSFSYTVQDQFGNTCTETVHINVCPPDPIPVPNHAPVVLDEFVNVQAGAPVSAHESALLANDSDPDGNPLSIQSVGQPAHGTLSRAADGTLTYTAHAGYSGEDSFTYLVSDGQGGLTQGTVHLNVAPGANRPPVVMGEEAGLRAGSAVSAPESLLLANDSDPDGGPLSIVPTGYSQPAHGTLSRAADGTLTYKPNAGYVGDDSFTYTVCDAQGNTSQGTVTLHVGPGMAAPTITTVDDNQGPTQGPVAKGGSTDDTTPALIGTAEPLARVDVYDGSTLIGTTQANAQGQWTLTPATPLDTGPHHFQVRATAADGASADSNPYDITVVPDAALEAPVVQLTDDANNDGILTRDELAGATRVDVRVDLPDSIRVGDLVEVKDNAGQGVSKRVVQADVDSGSITFPDAFPLPASGATLVVTAKITDIANNVSPMAEDRVTFNGNFSPIGSDDAATVRALAAPVATFLAMSQDSSGVLPGGQTWHTADGDAGRAVYGQLTDLLAPGMKVQVSSSDRPGVWFDAVISADGRHWTAVDAQAHSDDWRYTARVADASGQAVSPTVSQDVVYQGGEAKAPTIEGFEARLYSPGNGYQPVDSQPAIGGSTDATRLAIKGQAAERAASAGNTITVYDNGTDHPIGSTTVQADGSWILDLRGTRDFSNGGRTHNFYAQETNASGEAGAWSNKADLKIDNQVWISGESFAYMGVAAANSSGTHTGSMGTIDGSVQVTAISSDKAYNGVVDRAAYVSPSFQNIWYGSTPTKDTASAVLVSQGASLTLNFSKPVTDPNLFFQQLSADLSFTATDAKGNTFSPTLYQVANNGSLGAVDGNQLLGAGKYGQGLIGLQGDIVSITLTQTGSSNPNNLPFFVQPGQRLPTVGGDPGADDGSITPGALVHDTTDNDVLSFASQAELDSALAQGLDAGSGTDTLSLSGSDMRLNLSLHSSTPGVAATLNNVERFELGTGAHNTLEMSINDVLAQGRTDAFVANGKTQVMVNGDSSDTLSLTPLMGHGGDAGHWVRVGTVQVNGSSFVVFEHSALQAQVLAQQGLRVQVPAEPGTPAATADLPANTGNVLANDSDPDGRQADLRVAGVDNNPGVTPGENLGTRLEGQYGHLTLNADGSYSYVADKSFGVTAPAVDVFYYLPKDAEGQSAVQPSRLTFTVQPVQANVVAVSAPEAEVEGNALTYTVQTSDAAVPTALLLELLSGTATVGQDTQGPLQANLGQGWVDVVGGLVTLPAHTTSFQVRVATVDDSTFEQTEALSLKVISANGSSATGAGTVMDNDLSGTATGTEDTLLTLSWADFGLNQLAAALPKLVISALPERGWLEHDVNGIGRAVQVGDEISRADIDAGKLRFWPKGDESGIDAYQRSGAGNKLSDYAQFKYTAYGADGSTHTDSTMTIDIAPKADVGTLSFEPIQSNLAPNASVFTLRVNGSSPDQDGSEQLLVSFRVFGEVTVGSGPANPYWSPMTPDANGRYWAAPGSQIQIAGKPDSQGNLGSWSAAFDLHVREVNLNGDILDEAIIPAPGSFVSVWWRWTGGCPLALDLDGNGVQTVGLDQGVNFDVLDAGQATNVGWTDDRDGLLVLDRNGNGRIDSGAELYGQGTTLADGHKAADGFVALAEADDNGDGVINAQDAVFAQLQVWVDANLDGQTQGGELKGLGELGIVAFNLKAEAGTEMQHGNLLGLVSDYTTADGQQHDLVDVWFEVAPTAAAPKPLAAADLLQAPSPLERATASEAPALGQQGPSAEQLALVAQHGLRHAGLHFEPELPHLMH